MDKQKIASLIQFEGDDTSTGFVNAGGNVGASGYLHTAEIKTKEYLKIRKEVMSALEQAALIILHSNDARCIVTNDFCIDLLYGEGGDERAGGFECWLYGIGIDPASGRPEFLIDWEGNRKDLKELPKDFNYYELLSRFDFGNEFFMIDDLRKLLEFIDSNPQDCQYFR